ncbi:sensor histidine kinase [Paenibacillus ihbetae]|uniref:histidine kinase n=1 Tax=Paenibacillus ihbetae TaxID=1870820 RepID=A0ABX3JVF6_9BACL|nr:sensor histidine kinase [Paenibacillus ihbetae]OOC61433.1 hypothetical protein BBD40_05765 [Paenibacillus ihbetae]
MGQRLRQSSLRRELLHYVILLSVCLIAMVLLGVLLNRLAINAGLVVHANYDERRVLDAEPGIQNASTFSPELIPEDIPYAVVDKDTLRVVEGTLDPSREAAAVRAIQNRSSYQGQAVYRVVEREQEYVVLHYKVRSRFTLPWLRAHFPDYEVTTLIIGIISIISIVLAVTTIFARRLQRQFDRIQKLTVRIRNRDLSMEEERSPIKEFDDVLASLQEMAKALEESLQAQWRTETRKREQISALAHDIKIPVTIIKGNAELLSLDDQSEEHAGYTEYILNATSRIEEYVSLLIHISKTEQDMAIALKPTSLRDFAAELIQDVSGYVGQRRLEIVLDQEETVTLEPAFDRELLLRAIMNILTNAADHTPDGGEIRLAVSASNRIVSFRVTDSGPGFTREGLEQATQLFYMGDKSRSAKGHYGIGLTFAHNVARLHQGSLRLANRPQGGAEVTLEIPARQN